MAQYKGRDVKIKSHVPVELKVVIQHADFTQETVNLADTNLKLSTQEVMNFIKDQHKQMETEQKKIAEQAKQDEKSKQPQPKQEVKPVLASPVAPHKV
jgi:hypothetical protein